MNRVDGTPCVRFPLIEDSLESLVGVVYASAVLHNYEALDSGASTLEEPATRPLTVATD
jgi:CBS domain containing-hemolysin-like protein